MHIFEFYLIGFDGALAATAALLFLSFWRRSRDRLFIAFALAFLLEALESIADVRVSQPNFGDWWTDGLRLAMAVIILVAIAAKNFGAARPRAAGVTKP